MVFDELLAQLPTCPGVGGLPVKSDSAGFGYVERSLPEFIGPDLSPSDGVDQSDTPRVVILSAAGAVGKSTLAREIAFAKRAPLWDLAQADAVGGNSLTGQISASFGFKLAGEISAKLDNGELFLIVDALDEARVKANEAGFEAFVRDIAEVARAARGVAFVLLGRTQTALWTSLLLEDAGVQANLVSIRPFTRDQAERYIEARIGQMNAAARKRIADHRGPFEAARNLVFQLLERAIGGDAEAAEDSVREFLGYAPVLETVAVLLGDEGNYQELIGRLTAMGQDARAQIDRPLRVLDHVVKRLMERERAQKLQHNIRPALQSVADAHGWDAWETLYQADEQISRLLGRILKRSILACPEMPPALRAAYEERLAEWLPEHPFLREGEYPANKVFESYLFAVAMREYLTDISRHVEAKVADVDYKPSRLLADFYILLGEKDGTDVVSRRQIGYLYDSFLAGETGTLQVRLAIDEGDPDEDDAEDGEERATAEGEFELVYASADGSGRERIETRSFKIDDSNNVLAFRRQLKDATIVTRGGVSLGGLLDDFEIGPRVDMRCGHLEFKSTGLVARGAVHGEENDGVTLEAQGCDSKLARKPVVRGKLSVFWPGADGYPWTEYATAPGERFDDARMHQVSRRLRRIVLTLRSHSKGSLARLQDKVEHRRVLKGPLGEALLAKLCDDGVLELREGFYHWVPDRAAALLQISWHDLRNRQMSQGLREYLQAFIQDNAGLF